MTKSILTNTKPLTQYEKHAQQEGAIFGNDIVDILKNWQGPSTIATIAGYIASKDGIQIGNTQLGVGLAMLTAGAVTEAVALSEQHPEMNITQRGKKVVKEWLKRLQGPSNISLMIGIVGMLKKIKGSEAAFIAGAIGTVLNIVPILYDNIKSKSSDEYIQR